MAAFDHGAPSAGKVTCKPTFWDMGLRVDVMMNELDAVKSDLNVGACVNTKGERGMTALHYAAREGNSKIVELLLRFHAQVNAVDDSGWTPLHYAMYRGHKEVALILLRDGADPDIKNRDGATAEDIED